jgi:hypothetical protein
VLAVGGTPCGCVGFGTVLCFMLVMYNVVTDTILLHNKALTVTLSQWLSVRR